jgi:predicted metalloprotease with PDZ domain
MADLKATLAAVSGDAAFADMFFARYIQGHEVVDFAPLLARAGLLIRPVAPRAASAGGIRLNDAQGRVRVVTSPMGSPAYEAGLERDDVLLSVGGKPVTRASDVEAAVQSKKPGDSLPVTFERRGQRVSATMKLVEDSRREIVPAEQAGQTLTMAQRRFREAWLGSQRNGL